MLMRAPLRANRNRQQVVRQATVPAPVGGWDAVSPLAAMPEDHATQLDNWFPRPGYVEVRRGHRYHAWDLADNAGPVETLMVWQGKSSSKMFAASVDAVFDVTTRGQSTTEVVSSLTDPYLQWVNFTNAGANYLYFVNGIDAPRHYNGTSWATPTITGITASEAVHINVHKKRIWFTIKNSTKAAYLATDAIAGAATEFELGSNFDRGGYLMAMATWTRDGGSGADDFAVFISSRGQLAIYQGTDPDSAVTWSLIGVFDIAAPIGRRCFERWGNDLLVITVEGVYSLSSILSVDTSSQQRLAITRKITNAMTTAARSYSGNQGWQLCVYPKGTQLILNVPTDEFVSADQYVMNTLTGAWCRFKDQNAVCWVNYNDNLYFGGIAGDVYQADTGSADVDQPVTAIGETAYNAYKDPGRTKRWTAMQPLVISTDRNFPQLGISTDFQSVASLSTQSVTIFETSGVWDEGTWDASLWAQDASQINDWTSPPALGKFGAVRFQARTGTSTESSESAQWGISEWGDPWSNEDFSSDEIMQINGFVLTYETGDYY
jgi:hypothetical protein